MPHYQITTLKPEHFAQLEELQRIVYPTLGEQELMRVEHFASQYTFFAEGQVVVLDGVRVIGQGSGFFTDFDFEHPAHTFAEFCDHFYFCTHDPAGAYYYGADISVQLMWEFDASNPIHARHIVTDHVWRILLDRGLDIFQHQEMSDAFAFANRLQ